jgi:hypothetical protein
MQRTVVLPLSALPNTDRSYGGGIGWSRTENTIIWPTLNKSVNVYELWSINPDGTDFHMLFSTDQFAIWALSFVAR